MIIDGKHYASLLRAKVADRVAELKSNFGIIPHLAVLWLGSNAASSIYINNKRRFAREVGIESSLYHLVDDFNRVYSLLNQLNNDPSVHGILVQLPLPPVLDKQDILNKVSPEKDVDGFNIANVGALYTQQECFLPCTAYGIMLLLKEVLGDLTGKKALVIGRSQIVGRPVSELLLQANCTVTIGHSYSRNVCEEAKSCDILVAAAGVPYLVTKDWIKPGACVIDVGIHRHNQGLCGDVDFTEAKKVVGCISPVPGGVGPMTIACLLANTLKAAEMSVGLPAHSIWDLSS